MGMAFRDRLSISLIIIIIAFTLLALVTECRTRPAQAHGHTDTQPSPVAHTNGRVYAYCLQGRTASGYYAQPGTIAAPVYIPLGTVLYIPGYGYGVVRDRMGAAHPHDFDVWFASCAQARQWGIQWTTITITTF